MFIVPSMAQLGGDTAEVLGVDDGNNYMMNCFV
jgi:hypothetical protein